MEGEFKQKNFFVSMAFLVIFFFGFGSGSIWAGYPEKSIKLIIGFAPGGITDLMGRALAQHVNPHLGGKVYVENISGAAGAIGFRAGAKADPDGYTLTVMVNSIAVGPHIVKGYPRYDLFDFICIVAQNPLMILVKAESPFKTIEDLIAYAKANPGKISGCHAGVGSLAHIAIAAFANAAGVKFTLVPYKGTGPCLTAAVGGHVDCAPGGVNEAMAFLEAKKLRPLIVLANKRFFVLPDIPAAGEFGYDSVINQWLGIGVPKGTPEEVKSILLEAFRKTMEDKNLRKFMDQVGLEQIFLDPRDSTQLVKGYNDYFKNVVTKLGLEAK